MSSKANRRAKGDKGPAKSSQSSDLMSSMASMGDINMDLLNGIHLDSNNSIAAPSPSTQCAVYFGNNDAYRNLSKLLSKKSYVTRQKALRDMGELIRTCDKQDVSMMIPSFCYYYDELLYCQSSQVRLEANKTLQEIGLVLGKEIGHFVKHFIVSLQIYMCDPVIAVRQVAEETFSKIIPIEKKEAVLNKYFEETLRIAESLLSVDSSVLEEHHEEKDNYDNSIQRLQLTSQIVYTYLLRLHIPLSPMSIEKYKKVLLKGTKDILEVSHRETLDLMKEIASQIPWSSLFPSPSNQEKSFKKFCRNLLFEVSKRENELISRLEIILALWIALSSKYHCIYENEDIQQYSSSFFMSLKQYTYFPSLHSYRETNGCMTYCKNIKLIILVFEKFILPHSSYSILSWCFDCYSVLQSSIKPSLVDQYLQVYPQLLQTIKKQPITCFHSISLLHSLASFSYDTLISIIPSFYSCLTYINLSTLIDCIHILIELNPSTYSLLRNSFEPILLDIQSPYLYPIFTLIRIFLKEQPEEVQQDLSRILRTVFEDLLNEPLQDIFILNPFLQYLQYSIQILQNNNLIITLFQENDFFYFNQINSQLISRVFEQTELSSSYISLFRKYIQFLSSLSNESLFFDKVISLLVSSTETIVDSKSYLFSILLHEQPSLKESCLSSIHSFTTITDSTYLLPIIEECEKHQDHSLLQQVLSNPSVCAIDFLSDLLLSQSLRESLIAIDGLSVVFTSFIQQVEELTETEDEIELLLEPLNSISDSLLISLIIQFIASSIQSSLSNHRYLLLKILLQCISTSLQPLIDLISQDSFWKPILTQDMNLQNLLAIIRRIQTISSSSFHFSLFGSLCLAVFSDYTHIPLLEETIPSFTPESIIHAFSIFLTIDPNSPYYIYTQICKKLVLQWISLQSIPSYLSPETPLPLLRCLIKRSCCNNKEAFEFNDKTTKTEAILTELHRSLKQVVRVLDDEEAVIPALQYASCYLNKYICFDSTLIDSLKQIHSWILEIIASQQKSTSPALLEAIMTFMVSLLSAYPLNQEQSELYEGNLWQYLQSFQSFFTEHPYLMIRCYKYMNQIHDLNGYTIDDSIYQGLVLLFNSLILSYIKTYLQTPSSQRNSFLLCRIFSSISTFTTLTASTTFELWLSLFVHTSDYQELIDLTMSLLLLIQSQKGDLLFYIQQLKQYALEAVGTEGHEVKLLLLMNLITAVTSQVQDKEILDISIVKKVEYDEETNTYKEEEEEIDEEEKARLFEEKKCQRNEFLHLMDQLTDLVTVLSKANLFKRCLLHCIQAISSKSKLTKTKSNPIDFSCSPFVSSHCISLLPVYTYYSLCNILPSVVQSFFINDVTGISSYVIQAVIEYTQLFITPAVVAAPIKKISVWLQEQKMEDSTVTSNANKYSLTLMSGTTAICLGIVAALNYPMNLTVTIQNHNHFLNQKVIDHNEVLFRQRLSHYLSLGKGIVYLARSIMNLLDSVEPCPICYCTLHPTNSSLPDKQCSECVGKFHSDCLNIWFRTSQNHTCPLCRQVIHDSIVSFKQTN